MSSSRAACSSARWYFWEILNGLDVLPYHTMGVAKYERLGIPYPLAGVEPMDASRARELRATILAARERALANRG